MRLYPDLDLGAGFLTVSIMTPFNNIRGRFSPAKWGDVSPNIRDSSP